MDALERAINIMGSRVKLATAIGITPQAMAQWRYVPANRVIPIERATGGKVSREALRPDLYPRKRRNIRRD